MILKQVGETTEGWKVVSGVFEYIDTHGFPLPDLLEALSEKQMIPCWELFIKDARKANWQDGMIYRKMKEACQDQTQNFPWQMIKPRLLKALNVF